MRIATLLVPLYFIGIALFQTASMAQSIRIEAESGALSGFTVFGTYPFLSGDAAIEAPSAPAHTATYTFSGWSGPYNITVGYCDEDDGTSSYTLSGSSVGTIASWLGDLPAVGTNNCNATSLQARQVATSVTLGQGETITLECLRDPPEPCRVDYFDFTYVGPMPPVGERAFPGAMGFGESTSGARGLGADVCIVTTLADSGPGSFRACAEQTAPAYVTFAITGYIDLSEPVSITGNKTIECATAPGDGVVFRRSSVDVTGDNVILRGCRAWAGKEPGGEPLQYRDTIFVGRNGALVRNAIVANSSMMFGTDENTGTWYEVNNVTFQHNISAWATLWTDENEDPHGGYGMLVGNDVATVSVVENYLAFNRGRNPLVGPDPAVSGAMITPVEFANNLIYCYGFQAARVRNSLAVHVVGNRFKPCSSIYSTPDEITLGVGTIAYVSDNTMNDGSPATIIPDETSDVIPEPIFTSPITPLPSDDVETQVLVEVGPARLLDFEIDAIEHYVAGTGGRIGSVEELGGWPTLEPGANPVDTDGDGMPDWWEAAHCSGSCAPTGDADGDGYENIEEWFHWFYATAFPGAKGFGARTSGARGLGAEVCTVTNLADNGVGSFRDCAEQTEPAYITFAVSGYIDLSDEVLISANKTIECSTAPGDGVVFRKARLHVVGDSVILRGCRVWPGSETGGQALAVRDAIIIGSPSAAVRDVMVANNSLMFATGKNGRAWFSVERITFQHNIAAWGLYSIEDPAGPHALGMQIVNGPDGVSVVENYFAFNFHANPGIGTPAGPVEVVNNLMYCFGQNGASVGEMTVMAHAIGNRFKKVCPPSNVPEIKLRQSSIAYTNDNSRNDGTPAAVDSDATSEASPIPLFIPTIAPVASGDVEERIFSMAGPAELMPLEAAAFEHYVNGTGGIIDSVTDVGGWPTLQGEANPPDTDGDGMPDWWEAGHCGGNCAPAGDHDGDGYENIEEWFHSLYKYE